jgi:hypothetical protein
VRGAPRGEEKYLMVWSVSAAWRVSAAWQRETGDKAHVVREGRVARTHLSCRNTEGIAILVAKYADDHAGVARCTCTTRRDEQGGEEKPARAREGNARCTEFS